MSIYSARKPMMDIFIFETSKLVEKLEICILNYENSNELGQTFMDEANIIAQDIMASALMLEFNNIARLAKAMTNLFSFLKEKNELVLMEENITDVIMDATNFIKLEINKAEKGYSCNNNSNKIIDKIDEYYKKLKKV